MRNIKRVWLWLLLVIFSSILLKAQSIPALTGVNKSIPGNISAAGVASFSVSFTPGSSPVDFVSINVSPAFRCRKKF